MAGFGNFNQNDFQRIVYSKYLNNVSPEETVISLHEETNETLRRLVYVGHFRLVNEPAELDDEPAGPVVEPEEIVNEPAELRREYSDSDNSGIDEIVYVPRDRLLRRVTYLYEIFAIREIQRNVIRRNRCSKLFVRLNMVYRVLDINRTVVLETLGKRKWIVLEVDSLKVTISRYKITIDFWQSASPRVIQTIHYIHGVGETTIQNADGEYRVPQRKYQSLAAKDFDFLVRNPTRWVSWKFDIKPHNRQHPFSSFFGKIGNYFQKFCNSDRAIRFRVVNFQIRIFERPEDRRTHNQGLIMKVLPFLNENTLKTIRLRVLKEAPEVILNSLDLRNCVQWQNCQILNIKDYKILINDFQQIAGIPSVRMTWQRNEYRDLFENLSDNIPRGQEIICTFPKIWGNEARRQQKKAFNDEVRECRRNGTLHRTDAIGIDEKNYCLVMEYMKPRNR